MMGWPFVHRVYSMHMCMCMCMHMWMCMCVFTHTSTCHTHQGDCGDLMAHMLLTLSKEVGGSWRDSSASRLKLLLSGDLRDAALQYGLFLGMVRGTLQPML